MRWFLPAAARCPSNQLESCALDRYYSSKILKWHAVVAGHVVIGQWSHSEPSIRMKLWWNKLFAGAATLLHHRVAHYIDWLRKDANSKYFIGNTWSVKYEQQTIKSLKFLIFHLQRWLL